jgi:hypothetical protein
VVQVAAAIEDHLLDALGEGALGDELATEASQVAPAVTLVRRSLSRVDAAQRVLWASSSMTWA